MERIADGAFSTDQMEGSKVVVPASSPAVTEGERVSASMALMGDAGQKERRSAWHEAGWRSDDIVMGKPCGALTETVAVSVDGAVERTDLKLVSYPGAHENAMDLKKPNAEGVVEQADNGLAFTVKSDMTVSVAWQGDKTATPAHIEIPATITIDDVTYPVTEIAASGFEGAAFLESVTIHECVATIGKNAFHDCMGLQEAMSLAFPAGISEEISVKASSEEGKSENNISMLADKPSESQESPNGKIDSGENGNTFGLQSPQRSQPEAEGNISPYFAATTTTFILTFGPNDFSTGQLAAALNNSYTGAQASIYHHGTIVVQWTTACAYSIRRFGDGIALLWISEDGGESGLVNLAHGGPHPGRVVNDVSLTPEDGVAVSYDAADYAYFYGGTVRVSISTIPDPSLFSKADHRHDSLYASQSIIGAGGSLGLSGYSTVDNGLKALKDANASKADGSVLSSSGRYTSSNTVEMDIDEAKREAVEAKAAASKNAQDIAAINSSFGTISYVDIDASDESVYPTSYRKGGTPSIHAPVREGYEFKGWSWSRGGASGDADSLGDAFSEAGAVTLTAQWAEPAAPEARYFFTEDVPLRTDGVSGVQEHVIKVRLSGAPKTLSSVGIEGNDRTSLIRDTSRVEFMVGRGEDVLASGQGVGWGSNTPDGWSSELADLGDGSYGLYVGIRIPTDAIDSGNIVSSCVDGSYVASLVKLNYAFA